MINTNDVAINKLLNLFEKEGLNNDISQLKAKTLLKELDSDDETQRVKWSYIPSQLVRNIAGIMLELEDLMAKGYYDRDKFKGMARQVARAWECLGRLEERTSKETAFLNSAISYEMAGYQANALSMSRQLFSASSSHEDVTFEVLINAFLQRLFLMTRELSIRAMKEKKFDTPGEAARALGLAVTARLLKNVSDYFLSGDESKLESVSKDIQKTLKIFENAESIFEYNIIRSLGNLIPMLRLKSTWTKIGELLPDKRWKRYLKLLSRGLGSDLYRSPSVSELWPSQIEAIENGLIDRHSKIFRMPTSAGKTRVAEIAMVYTLISSPGSKIIYTAPYKALVYEIQQNFNDLFSDLGFRVSSLGGNYETDEFEQAIAEDTDVLVITPEKLDLMFRINPNLLEKVRLFILDEGQIVSNQKRGVKFELLITRIKKRFPEIRFLFLSAVISDQTLSDFASWFKVNDKNGIVKSEWRPSIQRYAKFNWNKNYGMIQYTRDVDLGDQFNLNEFIPRLIKEKKYSYKNPATGRINAKTFPESDNKGQTAAELAIRFADLGPVLVFCSQTNFADSVAKAIQRRIELSKNAGETPPGYLMEPNCSRSIAAANEWLGTDHFLVKNLKRNVAVHHGKIPDLVRKAIEHDFRERKIRILVATNTLAQGVNLPIRTVIVHSTWRHDYDGEHPLSSSDYWNIAGRAGRAGQETEGTVIHIVMSKQDQRDFENFKSKRENVEPMVSGMYSYLKQLVESRITTDALNAALDPDVLAMVVEEGENLFSQESVREVINESLTAIQARRDGVDDTSLQNTIFILGKEIETRSSFNELTVFSSTGLSSESCRSLSDYIKEEEESIRSLLTERRTNDIDSIIELMVEPVLGLQEMQSQYPFLGNLSDLLKNWIQGRPINAIMQEMQEDLPPEDLSRVIEDLLINKLPWGISAFLRISRAIFGFSDTEISQYLKFFPSMVKYGVPSPEAAWAMSSGIPFRRTAIEIASAYAREVENINYKTFQEWVGNISTEDLSFKYMLKDPVLTDVNKELSQSFVNDMLRSYSEAREALPHESYIKGIQYQGRYLTALNAKVGEQVCLERDYNNTSDRNAIRVLYHGSELGYLDKKFAQLLAPDMDSGLQVNAKIIDVRHSEVPSVKIRIYESDSRE